VGPLHGGGGIAGVSLAFGNGPLGDSGGCPVGGWCGDCRARGFYRAHLTGGVGGEECFASGRGLIAEVMVTVGGRGWRVGHCSGIADDGRSGGGVHAPAVEDQWHLYREPLGLSCAPGLPVGRVVLDLYHDGGDGCISAICDSHAAGDGVKYLLPALAVPIQWVILCPVVGCDGLLPSFVVVVGVPLQSADA